MKLRIFGGSTSSVVLAVILAGAPNLLAAENQAKDIGKEPARTAKTPSWFKADKDGVLWFQQGDDGETEYSSSLVLSAVTDGIVITVTANKKHIEDAVSLARKMQTVLQSGKHTPDKIPIVAVEDDHPGVGYTFYTDGLAYSHESLGKNGLFTPSAAKKVLSGVAKHYRILREEFVAAGKWGKDHAGWTALKIVRP